MDRQARRRVGIAIAAVVTAAFAAAWTTGVGVNAHDSSTDTAEQYDSSTPSAPPGRDAIKAAPAIVIAAPTPAPTVAPAPAPTPVPTPAPDTLPGQVVTATMGGHPYYVYVPGAYAAEPTTAFPVVYFLHGSPGNAESWLTGGAMQSVLDGLITGHQLRPIIAVFPDDQGVVADDSYWGNTPLGDNAETWFVNALVPTIDGAYRTLGASGRGIAGLSAGGFGAVNLALRHPGMFNFVGSYSGVFSAPDRLFGADSAANSPAITIDNLPTGERFALYLGGGAQDSEFGADTQNMIATVAGLGWSQGGAPLDAEFVPGPHSWEAWSAEARDSLIWLGSMWGRT